MTDTITLTLDREQARSMNGIINAIQYGVEKGWLKPEMFETDINPEIVTERLQHVMKVFSDAYHEAGWCVSPQCPIKR